VHKEHFDKYGDELTQNNMVKPKIKFACSCPHFHCKTAKEGKCGFSHRKGAYHFHSAYSTDENENRAREWYKSKRIVFPTPETRNPDKYSDFIGQDKWSGYQDGNNWGQ